MYQFDGNSHSNNNNNNSNNNSSDDDNVDDDTDDDDNNNLIFLEQIKSASHLKVLYNPQVDMAYMYHLRNQNITKLY